jgi:hypothetical protein
VLQIFALRKISSIKRKSLPEIAKIVGINSAQMSNVFPEMLSGAYSNSVNCSEIYFVF